MRFAVSLLTVLAIASIIGTVLKQNEPYENYIIKFGQFWFEMFEKLGLFDVYHTSWFLVILLFLVISTTFCIYRNAPTMLKEWKTFKEQAAEQSLSAFSHHQRFSINAEPTATRAQLEHYLDGQGFKFKVKPQENGDTLIAAKSGTHQRLGYILTHAAIVIICFGGLLDGNLPFKIQELLGKKKIEVLDIPVNEVPDISRMGANNLSFRANMTLPEGASGDNAFIRIKDGYLVQQLPFRLALKKFRIEHYATGQPKSFESDVVIYDPSMKEPFESTISVNHPLIHKGIAIYQSDFQDGGSDLKFNVWDLSKPNANYFKIDGQVMRKGTLANNNNPLTVEFNEFRPFNILNLSPDGKGKPKNVGPNTTYKLRDSAGQAREYVTYMQPLILDGKKYFVSGMRETVQEDFKYLRIPADEDLSIDSFMRFRNVLTDSKNYPLIAEQVANETNLKESVKKEQFKESLERLLTIFAEGGYSKVSQVIEKAVPEAEQKNAATAYFKLLNSAALAAYNMSLQSQNKPPAEINEANVGFVRDSLNTINDFFFYGSPYLFELNDYTLKRASGFQLTKSPGQKWVYLGSVLLVLGIFSMFYIRERRIWLLLKGNQEVLLAMSSNRKNLDFDQEFTRIKTQLSQVLS
jgi:cytochrome c biogenesis protein